jgi:hypothetical protein
MKVKRMPYEQFYQVMDREWVPVQLMGTAIPEFLQNIPKELVHSVYGSATFMPTTAYSDPRIPSGNLLGGIDVYRHAPDDPVELNKDWYAVVTIPNGESMLLVTGPFADAEHWLNEIPDRLKGAEILGVPAKPKSK